jgi:hypothetical protein
MPDYMPVALTVAMAVGNKTIKEMGQAVGAGVHEVGRYDQHQHSFRLAV